VLRVICLGRLTQPDAAEAVVRAARRLIAEEPNVRSGEAGVGLRLMEDAVEHAHYSWIFDFDDRDAWQRYMEGEAHRRFASVVDPVFEAAILTEYEFDEQED
jgi:hypothetical protein